MRRMTICRSSAVIATLLAAASTGLAAQRPPAIQRPIQQGQRAADQTSQQIRAAERAGEPQPPQPAQQQQQQQAGGQRPSTPATHTVSQGETLWALAQQYLGDPLLWPEIYRLNTDVIEDPHWIYPGEELRLQPGEPGADVAPVAPPTTPQAVTVTPQGDTARPQVVAPVTRALDGPTIFSPPAVARITASNIDATMAASYRAVREGEYYSAGFLTEGAPLASGRVLANTQTSVRGAIRTRTSSGQFEYVLVEPPRGAPFDSGGLLLSFRRGEEVPGYGEIIIPTGLLRVEDTGSPNQVAQVLRQFDRVTDGQELLPIAPFRFETTAHPQAIENGIAGRVLRLRDRREVATLQDVLFIDKGANDGVRLGDVFAVTRDTPDGLGGTLTQDQARAIVVSTRERTSTAIIVELYRGDIGSRSLARQVRRIPS